MIVHEVTPVWERSIEEEDSSKYKRDTNASREIPAQPIISDTPVIIKKQSKEYFRKF